MEMYSMDYIRSQIIGKDLLFKTPFGYRNMFYADYTASGRTLSFIEEKILSIQKSYANTHTEDDYSGKYMTRLIHGAEEHIKKMVNAGKNGKIFAVGSGSTGALKKLQEIIGVYIPPVTKERISRLHNDRDQKIASPLRSIEVKRPVVFIGPYEHHTNELMWREAFADVVVVSLDDSGMIDLEDLENKLSSLKYQGRTKFASFSAGSNITGIRTKVYDIACICHRYNVFIFFDYAAIAPYVKIDMNRDPDSYFDAIFFSPHKFLGGPGSSGILIIHDKLYRKDLPPTTAGGGTVIYVGSRYHDFADDIEAREKAGTPPILQTIKAAFAMELKEKIGIQLIKEKERTNFSYFLKGLKTIPNIQIIGTYDDNIQTPIFSFNIGHKDRILHPKFVTKLLNDLFGIQSRAGCSCAGPYGHFLLGIDENTSSQYRDLIVEGYNGTKPGWVRINIHYTFTREDIVFLLKAISFIAQKGHLFLQKYIFNIKTAEWKYLGFEEEDIVFSLDNRFDTKSADMSMLLETRREYLNEANRISEDLKSSEETEFVIDNEKIEKLKLFYYIHST